jgi:hypothetical protein
MSPAAGGMIAKTFFLAKIIHRIGTRSLRGKKGLHENMAGYRIFFALRAARRTVLHNPQDLRFPSFSLAAATADDRLKAAYGTRDGHPHPARFMPQSRRRGVQRIAQSRPTTRTARPLFRIIMKSLLKALGPIPCTRKTGPQWAAEFVAIAARRWGHTPPGDTHLGPAGWL